MLNFNICDSATPSPPYGITMLNCDGCSITLAWKSPKHCGGSKIIAYYIDKRDADTSVWKEVNQEAVADRICTVSCMTSEMILPNVYMIRTSQRIPALIWFDQVFV